MHVSGDPWFGAGGAGRLQVRLVGAKGQRNALWSMGAGRAEVSRASFSGETLTMRVVRGARRLALTGDETAKRFVDVVRLDAGAASQLGDATGARSGPLAKIVLYYSTHLANRFLRDVFRYYDCAQRLNAVIVGATSQQLLQQTHSRTSRRELPTSVFGQRRSCAVHKVSS